MQNPRVAKVDDADGVLVGLAVIRTQFDDGKSIVAYVTKRWAKRLRAELSELGVALALPIGAPIPEPKEGTWKYLGLVLGDVHVYERVR